LRRPAQHQLSKASAPTSSACGVEAFWSEH
jgi:hypothetical protein